MSIKNSLRLSLVLLASLPLVFMTFLTYILSYNKYLDLAKNSATDTAKTYAEGFTAELNFQIAEIKGLSNESTIQSLALENFNGVTLGTDSAYYSDTKELLTNTSHCQRKSNFDFC